MKKTKGGEKKNVGTVKTKKIMFEDIVFKTDEEAKAAGFVPDPALTKEDIEGCEVVIEDVENE